MAKAKTNPISSLFSIYATEVRIMILGLGIIMLLVIFLTVTGFIKSRSAAVFITDVFILITDILALVLGLLALFILTILDIIDFIWNFFAVITNVVLSSAEQLLVVFGLLDPPERPLVEVGILPLHLYDVDAVKTQMALDLHSLITTLRNIVVGFVIETSNAFDNGGKVACDELQREFPEFDFGCE